MKKLKFGIPKGSLQKATINLFEKSGWRININGRSYFPDINDEESNVPSAGPRRCPGMLKTAHLTRVSQAGTG